MIGEGCAFEYVRSDQGRDAWWPLVQALGTHFETVLDMMMGNVGLHNFDVAQDGQDNGARPRGILRETRAVQDTCLYPARSVAQETGFAIRGSMDVQEVEES